VEVGRVAVTPTRRRVRLLKIGSDQTRRGGSKRKKRLNVSANKVFHEMTLIMNSVLPANVMHKRRLVATGARASSVLPDLLAPLPFQWLRGAIPDTQRSPTQHPTTHLAMEVLIFLRMEPQYTPSDLVTVEIRVLEVMISPDR